MSRQVRERRFHCLNDCVQTGCPGHTATLSYEHASDTRGLDIDGERRHTFDANAWRAFVNLDVELRENRDDQDVRQRLRECAGLIRNGIEGWDSIDWARAVEVVKRELDEDVSGFNDESYELCRAPGMRKERDAFVFTDERGDKWRLRPTGDPSWPLDYEILERAR